MFKLTITGIQYNLVFQARSGKEITAITSYNITDIIDVINRHFPGKVMIYGSDGIFAALIEMKRNNHNVAEFGVLEGRFTVSYFDDKLERL